MSSNQEDGARSAGPPPGPPGWGPPVDWSAGTFSGPPLSGGPAPSPPPYLGAPLVTQPHQPPAIPYGVPSVGYAQPPVWVPPVPVYPYAVWSRRAGGYLIDFAPAYLAQIVFWIGYVTAYLRLIEPSGTPTGSPAGVLDLMGPGLVWMTVGFVLMLAAIGWQWYNRWLTGGRTGQSLGRRILKTKLVAEVNGRPIGAVNAFLRDLLHVLDGFAYLGFLWPLWDAKRQTFADMIMKTVVVDLRGYQGPSASDPGQPGQVAA